MEPTPQKTAWSEKTLAERMTVDANNPNLPPYIREFAARTLLAIENWKAKKQAPSE